jgi:hypothetical protein
MSKMSLLERGTGSSFILLFRYTFAASLSPEAKQQQEQPWRQQQVEQQ